HDMSLLSDLAGGRSRTCTNSSPRQPRLESLEDRLAPSVTSSINSNFNGTAIPANDSVWFSSVGKVTGVGSTPTTLHLTNASIASTAPRGGTSPPSPLTLPNADVTFSAPATQATTPFDSASNTWETTVPLGYGGNVFLDGLTLPVPGGLPGGIHPVSWQADF